MGVEQVGIVAGDAGEFGDVGAGSDLQLVEQSAAAFHVFLDCEAGDDDGQELENEAHGTSVCPAFSGPCL